MNIENIRDIMDNFDLGSLLPEISSIMDIVVLAARLFLLLGPFVLLGLGLYYFLGAPKEANYRAGYRFRWGMASVESWQFMQKLAGAVWSLLGLGLVIAMAILGAPLAKREVMDMLWTTAGYIALQAGLALVSCLLINLIVFVRYDSKGRRRYTWIELFKG